MNIEELPLEINLEVVLRTHDGTALRNFYHTLSHDDAPNVYNMIVAQVLETLVVAQRKEHAK